MTAADGLGLRTIAIDAGHGGKDPGAVSGDRKWHEKDFTLDIAGRLADRISDAYPEVKVVKTRPEDVFVSLNDRAVKANKAEADLFISIHINAAKSTSPNGYSVHILGQSSVKNRDLFAYNMDVCMRENSVIRLEEDYTTKYQGFDPDDPESFIFMQLMHNSNLEQSMRFASIIMDKLKGGPIRADRGVWQNPFYVLWKTSMPAVLVELGFISNSEDLSSLKQDEKRDEIAERLFQAFKTYKTEYDASVDVRKPAAENAKAGQPAKESTAAKETLEAKAEQKTAVPEPGSEVSGKTEAKAADAAETPATVYGWQIFAVGKLLDSKDSRFLGYEPYIVKGSSIYKYVIGTAPDVESAKKNGEKIRAKYPGAFLVKVFEGNATRL